MATSKLTIKPKPGGSVEAVVSGPACIIQTKGKAAKLVKGKRNKTNIQFHSNSEYTFDDATTISFLGPDEPHYSFVDLNTSGTALNPLSILDSSMSVNETSPDLFGNAASLSPIAAATVKVKEPTTTGSSMSKDSNNGFTVHKKPAARKIEKRKVTKTSTTKKADGHSAATKTSAATKSQKKTTATKKSIEAKHTPSTLKCSIKAKQNNKCFHE